MATTDSDCKRLRELEIPKNDKNICWWLSVNLALFHKRRPEFDAIGKKRNADISKEQLILLNVYEYYSRNLPDGLSIDEEYLTTGARQLLAGGSYIGASVSASATAPSPTPAPTPTTTPTATPAPTPAPTTTPNAGAPNASATAPTTTPTAPTTTAPTPTPTPDTSPGERPFQIDSPEYQSVSEYFQYIINIFATNEDSLNTIFIPIINGSPFFIEADYDVYYHAKYFGLPRITDSKNPIAPGSSLSGWYEFPEIPIPSSRSTLVFNFDRLQFDPLTKEKKYTDYEIYPLQTITLPTVKKGSINYSIPIEESKGKEKTLAGFISEVLLPITETSSFALDAITVSSPGGGHFVTYVNCGDTWLYDNGHSQGPLATKDGHRVFTSFEEMMKEDGENIRKNLVLLYYSKITVPQISTNATVSN